MREQGIWLLAAFSCKNRRLYETMRETVFGWLHTGRRAQREKVGKRFSLSPRCLGPDGDPPPYDDEGGLGLDRDADEDERDAERGVHTKPGAKCEKLQVCNHVDMRRLSYSWEGPTP